MIKFLKKSGFIILLALLFLICILPSGKVSYADTINHYIQNSIFIKENGKVETSLTFSCYFPESYNGLVIDAFKTQLRAELDVVLQEKQTELLAKYNTEDGEKYNPLTAITFGKEGKAEKGKNSVFYTIEYSSLDVYKYYNNYHSDYKEGFLMDKYSLLIENPFNDDIEINTVFSNLAEKYKQIYISASEVVRLDDYVKEYYNPYYYNDFITLNRRMKSTSYTVIQDVDDRYHHIWISDGLDLTGDQEMKLTLNVINYGWWYLFGISIPLVVMTIALIIVKLTNKQKKKINS